MTSIAVGAVLLAGCSERETPVSAPATPPATAFSLLSSAATPDTIADYEVRFDGRTFANNQTTFTYIVSGTGVGEDLTHFLVELPPCAPAPSSYSPTGSASINTNQSTGIYGIEWHLQVGHTENPGRTYSITFPGDVPLGVVRGQVTKGSAFGVGEIPGACGGFKISGFVFADADSNAIRGQNETGIANVTVALLDAFGHTDTTRTDAAGAYEFIKIDGTYTVRIDAQTAATDDFNEDLAAQFDVTTPTSLTVTVGPDSPDNNFGFKPRVRKLIDDLQAGTLITTGESAKFWKRQIKGALTGTGNPEYDVDMLLSFVLAIEELALPTPYQFTDGHELEEAAAILGSTSHDEISVLRRELLATEFNHVSGRGLVDELDLQLVLIAWGEGLLAGATTTGDITPYLLKSPLDDAGDLFGGINGATGGGGTN